MRDNKLETFTDSMLKINGLYRSTVPDWVNSKYNDPIKSINGLQLVTLQTKVSPN